MRWSSCSSTSTGSRSSTTGSGIRPVTRCCVPPRNGWPPRSRTSSSPASAGTSSCSCIANRIASTPPHWQRGSTPCSNGRSPSMGTSCSSRRASASPTPPIATPARRSSVTPTPRCTRPRTAAGRGPRCSTRRCGSGPPAAWSGRTRCATRSTEPSSGSSTSRSSRWPTGRPSVSRRCCGGTTRCWAVSARLTSSPSPRTRAASSRSAHGSSTRPSASSRCGTATSVPTICG